MVGPLPDYDMSNVVGVSWKADNTYPTSASGLSSTYLAESELIFVFVTAILTLSLSLDFEIDYH
jgi:hypothetical protein